MDRDRFSQIDLDRIETPCYLVDEVLLENNLRILSEMQRQSGCRILLALKAFAMVSLFPLIREALPGVSASSPWEARLGKEAFGGEVQTYSPAYSDADIRQLVNWSDTLIFNSFGQWQRYRDSIPAHIQCGLRINPEYSEIDIDLYNPCARGSRLGITRSQFRSGDLEGISGLHFHTLCEQNADTLERTLAVIEEKFGAWIGQMRWMNFGGGHHLTRDDYDRERAIRIIRSFRERYGVDVILEPGEAVALNTGVLIASVVDIMENDQQIAILDTSAEAHMPDVIAMPYRPEILGADKPGVHPHTYRLAGNTCLAGDIIGDYSFPEPLKRGSKLIFMDMAHYTMVKNSLFNGVRLPAIRIRTKSDQIRTARDFHYEDYKNRL
ncbi:MAG: carboxynorspermidine decarboxylase [bacterium]